MQPLTFFFQPLQPNVLTISSGPSTTRCRLPPQGLPTPTLPHPVRPAMNCMVIYYKQKSNKGKNIDNKP